MAVVKGGPAFVRSTAAESAEVVSWYRDMLARTAPPQGLKYPPIHLGPTWEYGPDGWVLPEATLGWDFLAWTGTYLRGRKGPWTYTPEQARFILWYYALEPDGEFVYHSAALQRLKGWGKDPVAATVSVGACFAPTVFDHWDGDRPVGRDNDRAWVQVVAVSREQTKNTMKLMPALIPAETRARYGIQVGKENVWGLGDTRQIQSVTSSVLAIEGGRPTQIVRNETQNWLESNQGHDMAGAIEGNAAKSEADTPARMLDIFNAYRPGQDSVAQRLREAIEDTLGDADAEDERDRPSVVDFGVLYDSLEAPPDAPLTLAEADEVLRGVRGDAVWLNAARIKKSIGNPSNAPSESRRKWYNQITASEDAWTEPNEIDPLRDLTKVVEQGEEIVLFFDGSKSDDATGLVGCRMSDGHVFTLGMWQRPPGRRGDGWLAPREDVDAAVIKAHSDFRVTAFFGDPSHVLTDETADLYWDPLFQRWHERYKGKYRIWADGKSHAVMFDMSDRAKSRQFAAAVAFTLEEIKSGSFTWDGDARMRRHLLNARRYPVQGLVSIAKSSRESKKKIDLAVCAVGARMVRRMVLSSSKRGGGGRAW